MPQTPTPINMYALYLIQPDDANHLIVYDEKGRRVAYIRPNARELKCLLRGDANFVESGAWSEEAKKEYKKVAQLFKEGRIEYIVFKNYAGVERKFEYKVRPENVEIREHGFLDREYVLKLEDKTVKIRPLVRTYSGPYPWTVKVEEIPKKPVEKSGSRSEVIKTIDFAIEKLLAMYDLVNKVDNKTKKQELLTYMNALKVGLPMVIASLKKLREQLR